MVRKSIENRIFQFIDCPVLSRNPTSLAAGWFLIFGNIIEDLTKHKEEVFLVSCPFYCIYVYTSLHPEKKETILNFLKQGKIIPSPFFSSMSIQYGQEALIRNILLAKKSGLQKTALILKNEHNGIEHIIKLLNEFGIKEVFIARTKLSLRNNGEGTIIPLSILDEGQPVRTIDARVWHDGFGLNRDDHASISSSTNYNDFENKKYFTSRFLQKYFEPLCAIIHIYTENSFSGILSFLWQSFFVSSNNSIKEDAEKLIRDYFKVGSASDDTEDSINFAVFNPLPFENDNVIKINLDDDISSDDLIVVSKDSGRVVPSQINHKFSYGKKIETSLLIYEEKLPPVGLKKYLIKRTHNTVQSIKGVKSGRFYLENDFMRAEVDSKGLLEIFDKKSENVFTKFGKFELSAVDDEGRTREIDFQEQSLRISLVNKGPLEAGIRIRKRIKIREKHKRGYYVVKVWSTYYLRYNSPILEAELLIEAPENMYNLNVLFPCECGRVRETIKMSDYNILKQIHTSNDADKTNFNGFVLISDKKRSLSIFSERPSFYRLKLDNSRTVSINIHSPLIEPKETDGNSRSVLRLGILPGKGVTEKEINDLIKIYEKFSFKGFVFQGEINVDEDKLSLFSLKKNNVTLLALKPVENGHGYIVRMRNCSENKTYEVVKFRHKVTEVYECGTGEKAQNKLPYKNGEIKIDFEAKEVKTILILSEPMHIPIRGKSIA